VLKITTLVEDTKGEHLALQNEHGISFYIEKDDGHKILFDTGQSDAFLYNAAQMRIDLSNLDLVILSHGHYDHSGGFCSLANISNSFQLCIGQGFFYEKYAFRNGTYDFLGNNFDESFLLEKKISYQHVSEPVQEILTGMFILSNFPRIHYDEEVNSRFRLRRNGVFDQDLFDDEILLVVDTPRGLVVFLGCSHPGVRNMLDAVRERLRRPIHAVIGGTHLAEAKEPTVEKFLEYLATNREIGIIGLSHCTGKKVVSRLQKSDARFFHNVTGSSLFLE